MKILFYCPFKFDSTSYKKKFLGGIETLNLDLSIELAKKGYKIYLATLCNKTFAPFVNFVELIRFLERFCA